MKRLKVLLLSVLVLGGVLMAFSMLIPARSKVTRAINVQLAKDSLMNQLANLETWGFWHPQMNSDSARRLITYGPTRSGKNALLRYNRFSMALTGVTDSSLSILMTNPAGEQLASHIDVFSLGGDSCVVNWYADFHVKWYPWEKFRSIFFDNMFGPSLEANLKGMKAYFERK